jgi:hypothetical protein
VTVTDGLFQRTWQSALIASCFSLTACGGGSGEDSGGSAGGRIQSITFKYPGGGMLKDAPTALKATADSGLAVTFKSATPTTCTVSGDQLTLVAAGECLVTASQPGGKGSDGTQWAPADDSSQLFVVLKRTQLVTFTPPDYVLSAATQSIPLSATAESGLPVTFASSTPNVCAINGSTLEIKAKGSCAVTAVQAGDDTYAARSTARFVAVDPLLLADGFTAASAGEGTSDQMRTKQGGAVKANPWSNAAGGGWEWCNATGNNWCYRAVSDDGSAMTSALHVPKENLSGWWTGFNRIDIFAPGLTGFDGSGDTTSGLQVTTEQSLVFTLGVNNTLYKAAKPVLVHLDLGKRNGGCNVVLSAHLWPAQPGLVSYSIPLSDFAVTDSCGLSGVTAASLDNDVRKVPSPWNASGQATNIAAYNAALDTFKAARTSATTLLQSSTIVRARFWMMEFNDRALPDPDKDVPKPTPQEANTYATDLTIKGAITIQ